MCKLIAYLNGKIFVYNNVIIYFYRIIHENNSDDIHLEYNKIYKEIVK